MKRTAGFTLLELLVAMALFSILGLAVVSLLGQGLTIFSAGTSDTSMQDRLQALLPVLRADFAAMQPVQAPEVLPPPVSADLLAQANGAGLPPPPPPAPPGVRLRSGWLKLRDVPTDWPSVYYVAFARTNARESEDPILREAGTAGAAGGVPLRDYEPALVDRGERGTVRATGGLLEVVWIAVPEDPVMDRRAGPVLADSTWKPSILTLYRLFRAPVGGERTLLDPANFDTLAKIRAAGRAMHEGVLYFGVTFRNVFSRSWTDGGGAGKASDGLPYVGAVWDSTRALDKQFALFKGPDSLGNLRDDVFPVAALVELTLAEEGPFGFGRGETFLLKEVAPEEKYLSFESIDPLYQPGPSTRYVKVESEWVSTTIEGIDSGERRAAVARGRRGTSAAAHLAGAPVYVGRSVSTDVPLLFKDRYVRAR